ncbi:MAG TPA: GGDEF domain-containing protein [Gammaproteobacteria bacterium]|nr:GGDEF domain-containing protein [Gammaproteobacteria bacterium]
MPIDDANSPGGNERWKGIHRLSDSRYLLPVFVLALMGVLWAGTLHLIKVERNNAEDAAIALTLELTDIYEARMLRVLREIDLYLKIIRYAYEQHGVDIALTELEGRGLLPPEQLFDIGILDADGTLLAGTPQAHRLALDDARLQTLRGSNQVLIDLSHVPGEEDRYRVSFSQRYMGPDGNLKAIILVEVDAKFFVSTYDSKRMGAKGLLGFLTEDGLYLARRSGKVFSAGHRFDAGKVPQGLDLQGRMATTLVSPLDGVERYISIRELYGFPLGVLVGLSMEERLAAADELGRTYLQRAIYANIMLLLVGGLFWHMSHSLAESRRREVEAREAQAVKVEYLAYHDSLTGLANRSLLSRLLGQAIHQANRRQGQLAILFLDLDHFKAINDTLGHDAGDELLREVARRLQMCLRESDLVARISGDEFVVVLPEVEDRILVETVASKIIDIVSQPYVIAGRKCKVTASVGISLYPDDGEDEETLMKHADTAMYQAKEAGKNAYRFYSE